MIKKIALLVTTSIALNACATVHAKGPLPEELIGVWESNGYGYVVAYDGRRPQLFQHTGTICQPMPPGEGGPFGFFDTFVADADGSRIEIRNSAQQHSFQLERRSGLPAACLNPPANTPTGNFNTFAAYLERHYGFFDLYNINWQSRVAEARSKLNDQMTDTELFSLLESMLDGIHDAHLKLTGETRDGKRSYSGNRGQTEGGITANAIAAGEDPRKARRSWNRHIWEFSMNKRLLGGRAIAHKSDFVQYGMADSKIGYISFFAMGGYASKKNWAPLKDIQIAHKILNRAIAYFEKNGAEAVIIDNSINHGGFDIVAQAIASHFTQSPTIAYSKGPLDAPKPYRSDIRISPARGKVFKGPVYVLTSDVTVSAGEVLTLALRSQPNVFHAGEKTRGALSDSLSKYLQNGWELSLSNEEYRDHEGVLWEGIGILPDIAIPVFGSGDLKDGHYNAVKRLVEKIRKDLSGSYSS